MDTKPLLAYQISDDEFSVIVFDTNGASARRRGAGELGTEWEYVESCRRVQWADQYAGKYFPPMVRIENGWWLGCGNCEHYIVDDEIADGEDSDGRRIQPVVVGDWIYCSPECHDEEVKRAKEYQDAKIYGREQAQRELPWAEVSHVYVGGGTPPEITVLVDFPGRKGQLADWKVGESSVRVSRCDHHRWIQLRNEALYLYEEGAA